MINNADFHIPVDSSKALSDEQIKLRGDVERTQNECRDMKKVMQSIMSAVVTSSKANTSKAISENDSTSTCSSSTLNKTTKSVESIHAISSSTPEVQSSDLLEEFLSMAAEGKIDISEELLKELYNMNTRIDALNEVSSGLQRRWCEIDASIKELKSEIKDIKSEINDIKSEINGVKQYFKIDNLLLHKFRPPPNLSSLQCSYYVAQQLNYLLPHLPVPVSWEHISTAHCLPTKAKKSDVVVVRFCNRNIKDMIYKSRHLLRNGVSITEHLTEQNLLVYRKARELFGSRNAHTMNCKIFVDINGKSILVKTVDEVHKTFVRWCEYIGTNPEWSSKQRFTTTNNPLSFQNHTIRCKFYNPEYAAVLEKNNPTTTKYNNNNRRHQSYSGPFYYRHQRGHDRW